MPAIAKLKIEESKKYNGHLKVPKGFESIGNYCFFRNGDCLEGMSAIENDSVDLILTDPPYNLGKFMHDRNVGIKRYRDNHFAFSCWDDMEFPEWSKSMDGFFAESARVLKKRGALLLFMSLIKLETIIWPASLALDSGS